MDKNEFFILGIKKFLWAIIVFVVSVILHNVISGLFSFEEPVFFLIAVLGVPFYLIISLVYTFLIKVLKK